MPPNKVAYLLAFSLAKPVWKSVREDFSSLTDLITVNIFEKQGSLALFWVNPHALIRLALVSLRANLQNGV